MFVGGGSFFFSSSLFFSFPLSCPFFGYRFGNWAPMTTGTMSIRHGGGKQIDVSVENPVFLWVIIPDAKIPPGLAQFLAPTLTQLAEVLVFARTITRHNYQCSGGCPAHMD